MICTLEIQARDAQPVYVDVTGQARLGRRDAGPAGGRRPAAGPTPEHRRRSGRSPSSKARSTSINARAGEPDAAELPRSPRRRPDSPGPRGPRLRPRTSCRRSATTSSGCGWWRRWRARSCAPPLTPRHERSRREAAHLVRHAAGPGEPRRHAGASACSSARSAIRSGSRPCWSSIRPTATSSARDSQRRPEAGGLSLRPRCTAKSRRSPNRS